MMKNDQVAGFFADPWLKEAGEDPRVPDDALFVCAYVIDFMVDTVTEAAFLRRTADSDELWVTMDLGVYTIRRLAEGRLSPRDLEAGLPRTGRVFAIPRKDDPRAACLVLLGYLVRTRVGHYWPGRFIAGGIVGKAAFKGLVERIEHELDENARKAREVETEIILAARELKLNPEPTGKGSSSWRARCPETNHPLYIDAATNSFGCGWCKRKGGPEELRAFVKERAEWRRSKQGS